MESPQIERERDLGQAVPPLDDFESIWQNKSRQFRAILKSKSFSEADIDDILGHCQVKAIGKWSSAKDPPRWLVRVFWNVLKDIFRSPASKRPPMGSVEEMAERGTDIPSTGLHGVKQLLALWRDAAALRVAGMVDEVVAQGRRPKDPLTREILAAWSDDGSPDERRWAKIWTESEANTMKLKVRDVLAHLRQGLKEVRDFLLALADDDEVLNEDLNLLGIWGHTESSND